MRRSGRFSIALFAVSMSLAGCGGGGGKDHGDGDAAASEVEHMERRVLQSFKAKDAAGLAAIYSEDAVVMLPNRRQLQGRAAVQAALTEMLGDPAFGIETVNEKVGVSESGELAYTRGGYRVNYTDPTSRRPTTEAGYYVTIYRKGEDGSWKVIEDISTPGAAEQQPEGSGGPAPSAG